MSCEQSGVLVTDCSQHVYWLPLANRLPWRLCLGSKWPYKHAQGERGKAPNGTEPYGGCPALTSRLLSITVDTATIGPHTIPFAMAWVSRHG